MKTFLSVLTSGVLVTAALAIPQTFNNNGFLNAVGQQVEDAVAQPAAFAPGAEPKGKWSPMPGKPDVLKLEHTAVAFGVPASEITAERKDKAIAAYRIVYRADDDRKRGKQESSLEDRVRAGISAYTGQSATTRAPIAHKGVNIAVQPGKGGDVTVLITKAS
jgi:hypothetical protein